MGTARGYKSECVLDFETTFGEDPASPAGLIMPLNTMGVRSQRNKTTPATIRGNRNPAAPFDGNLSVSGGIQAPVDTIATGHWLRAMFGVPATTGSDPYTHTFTVGDTQPSLVLEKKFADTAAAIKYAKYNGCKIASWSMSVGGDGELVQDFDVAGADETLADAAYDSSASSVSIDRLNNFQASLTEGGSPLTIATDVDFTIDFGLDTDKYVIGGSGTLGDIPEGIIGVSGNLTALFQNDTLLNKAVNSTESSLVITLTDGDYSLVITFEELQYSRNTPGIEGPQGVLITLPFTGYFDDGASSSAITAALTNAQAGSVYGG